MIFLGKDDAARSGELFSEAVRGMVCSLLVTEPQGVDDFPTDERSLTERAVEYFGSGNSEDVQSFFNDKFEEIWNEYREATHGGVYFRSVSKDSAPAVDNQREKVGTGS